jgi:hypothetical protein
VAQDYRSTGASWIAWGIGALVTVAAALLLLLLLTADRADAALLPEPITRVVGEVTDSTPAAGADTQVTGTVGAIAEPVVAPVMQTVEPVAGPVVQTTAAVGDLVTPVLAPLGTPVPDAALAPGATNQPNLTRTEALVPSGADAAAPNEPPTGAITDTQAPTASRGSVGPSHSADLGSAPAPAAPTSGSGPIPTPPARPAAPSNGLDTTRVLELLLFAIAVTLAALTLPRGRRVLQFGAVKPRLAFVSSIERPG